MRFYQQRPRLILEFRSMLILLEALSWPPFSLAINVTILVHSFTPRGDSPRVHRAFNCCCLCLSQPCAGIAL